jgi:hypothetical protein
MDPEAVRTVVTSAASASVASTALASLAHKVLGPTAEYLGTELKEAVQKGVENTRRVFEDASRRLDQKGNPDGAVPPRVLRSVLDQAYFCEDELVAGYLGGVLASSKSGTSRDDRAVFYLSLIESLSVYQIRTHYILYSSILRVDDQDYRHVHRYLIRGGVTLAFLEAEYVAAMEFGSGEREAEIVPHCFTGLETKGLIEGGITFNPDAQKPDGHLGPDLHRFFYPTQLGIQLFLWGIGEGHLTVAEFTPELLGRVNMAISVQPRKSSLGHVTY